MKSAKSQAKQYELINNPSTTREYNKNIYTHAPTSPSAPTLEIHIKQVIF